MSKRKNFSVEEKAHIIFRSENNERNSNIATEFGASHCTISTIWKNRDKINENSSVKDITLKKFVVVIMKILIMLYYNGLKHNEVSIYRLMDRFYKRKQMI